MRRIKTKNNYFKYLLFFNFLFIVFISIGFSAFNLSTTIKNVEAYVSNNVDIRVASNKYINGSNEAYSIEEGYNVSNINGSVYLPYEDSYVDLEVRIVNLGNVEMGISKLNNSNSNLKFDLLDYQLGNKICEDIDELGTTCKNGVEDTITIRVKWSNYQEDNYTQYYLLNFDFEYFNIVSYENNVEPYINEIPKEVINGGTLKFKFDSAMKDYLNIYVGSNKILDYRYEDGYIILDNVLCNVNISIGYNIILNYNDGSNKCEIIHIEPDKIMKNIDIIPESINNKFLGWYTNSKYNDVNSKLYYNSLGIPTMKKYDLDDDLTLYAGYSNSTYTITYYADRLNDSSLNDSYTRLNYIESFGEQYIDSGVVVGHDITTEMKLSINNNVTQFFFGGRSGYHTSAYEALVYGQGNDLKFRFDFGSNEGSASRVANLDQIYNIKLESNKVYIDDEYDSSLTIVDNSFTNNINMYLFALNEKNVAKQFSYIKVYGVKIYDNNTLVRDYVPALRKNDNKVGLYDLVNNKFYSSKTSSEFNMGINTYSEIVAIDEERKLNSIIVSKDGYSLTGYIDDYGNSYSKNEVVKNLETNSLGIVNLYPIYEKKKYDLSFDSLNGDNSIDTISVNYLEKAPDISSINGSIPSRDGYIFTGWYDNKDYTIANKYYDANAKLVNNNKILKDTKLYAGWVKIESSVKTNGNQLIKTGVIPNQDTKVEIKIKLLSNKIQFIYGARDSSSSNMYSLGYISGKYRFDYNNLLSFTISSNNLDDVIIQDKNIFYVNGVKQKEVEYNNFSSTKSSEGMYLFNTNTSNYIENSNSTRYAEVIFYYMKIYDGDKLVRDYIPVSDINDKYALYDKVNNKLYYSTLNDLLSIDE